MSHVNSVSLQILEMNYTAIDIYGYNRNEFLKKRFHEFQDEKDIISSSVGSQPDVEMYNFTGAIFHQSCEGNSFPVKILSLSLKGRQTHLIKAISLNLYGEKYVSQKSQEKLRSFSVVS